MGTFSNKADLELTDDGVKILKEGSGQKFVDEVQQITFSGKYAMEHGQEITYITERCVFKLTPDGLMITEIAKGVDLEADILAHMAFRPLIADEIGMMDERLFRRDKMGIHS
jgi:propionate CoA-transferase